MKLLRSFPLLAFALVLLSIVGVCVAQGSVELLLVAGALAALSWSITEGPRGRYLPRWVCTLLLVAATLSVAVDLVANHGAWISGLGRYAVWITLIKLYDRKTPRDYGQLLVLSLLLMVIGAVQSSGLLYGLVLLVYAVLGAYVLLLFQLHASHDRAKSARAAGSPRGYNLVPNVKPIFGRHLGGHFQGLALGLGSTAFSLGVVVFLIFPRGLGEGVVNVPGREQQRMGFTDSINLQTGTRITQSRRPVFALRITDMNGTPIRQEGALLLRGGVLDAYDGGGAWQRHRQGLAQLSSYKTGGDRRPTLVDPLPPGELWRLEVRPYIKQRQMFSMLAPVAVDSVRPGSIHFEPTTMLLERQGAPSLNDYTVTVQPVPDQQTLRDLMAGRRFDHRNAANDINLLNPRVAQLARSIVARRGLPTVAPTDAAERYRWNREVAGALTDHFHTSGFVYDLDLGDVVVDPDASGDTDPIRRFLFETRRGHCEYFASGLAALAYNLDVPVRVIVGYVAYGYDETMEGYVVLDSNAHAWVEIETAPSRWSTFDPTPPSTLGELHGLDATLADRLSWIYERFEGSWQDGFMGYDPDSQHKLMGGVSWLTEWADATREWLSRVNRAFYFGPAGYIWMGVVAFALVLAVLVLVQLMRRTRRLRRTLHLEHVRGAEHQRLLRQLGFYLDMLQVLDRAKVTKPAWQPPLAHAATVESHDAEAGRIVRGLTARFYAARFGGEALDREAVRAASVEVDELAERLGVRRR